MKKIHAARYMCAVGIAVNRRVIARSTADRSAIDMDIDR